MSEKANWEPLELPLSMNIVNCIPGESAVICATNEDLKDAGVVIPTTSLFKLPNSAWRRQIDLGECNQIAITVVATAPDVILLLGQTKTEPPAQSHSLRGICRLSAGTFIMSDHFLRERGSILFSLK